MPGDLHSSCFIAHFASIGWLALIIVLWLPNLLRAESQPPQIVGVRVGFGDRYKVGVWTPVEITLRGGDETCSGRVSAIVPDGDGVPSRVSTSEDQPCIVEAGKESKVRLLCRFGRVRATLTAEFCDGDAVVARRTFQTGERADGEHFLPGLESQALIVVAGLAELGLAEVGKLVGVEPEHRPVEARVEDIEQLPTDWCGYEGVGAVALLTSRPEIYRRLKAGDARIRALEEWVRMGGRLILAAGARAEETIGAQGPLAAFAPGRFDRVESRRPNQLAALTAALESYCGSRTPAPLDGEAAARFRAARLADVQGIVESREGDLPLVVRSPRGFGQILFLAVDPDEPPIAQWLDRPVLTAKLLDISTGGGDALGGGSAMLHYGYGDLAGQLRSALDRFPGVRLAPFWLVAGLIAGYLLLIGPGDYFFLQKLVGRPAWTWLTFPLVVVIFGLGACALAGWFKGSQLKVNQANLVDVDAESGWVRGAAWLNVFSPHAALYDFAMTPQPADGLREARTWMAWLGLPGGELGGMNPRTGDPAVGTEPYDFSQKLDAMRGVPIQKWATKSFTSRWNGTGAAAFTSDLTDQDQLLSGTLTNVLAIPLEHCVLAYGRSAYDLGAIGPGESVQVGLATRRSELKTLLTGRRVVVSEGGDKFRQEATPYDQASTDAAYILRMMMFYEEAGGRRYTRLANDYQAFVDLGALLKAGRAILVAQVPRAAQEKAAGAALLCNGRPLPDGATEQVILYRVVFPVKKERGG